MADEIADFFEGSGGPPVISMAAVGTKVRVGGVILPQINKAGERVPYITRQQEKKGTGEPLWFDKDKTDAFGVALPGMKPTRPRPVACWLVQTTWRNWEGLSDNARERVEQAEAVDDGVRFLYVRGASASTSLRAAYRQVKPEIGGEVYLIRKSKKDKGDVTEVDEEATLVAPTMANAAIVAAYEERTADAEEVEAPSTADDELPF